LIACGWPPSLHADDRPHCAPLRAGTEHEPGPLHSDHPSASRERRGAHDGAERRGGRLPN
ncbi:MAG: hypothetical protein ACK559_06190, partial [bacterium]